MIFLLTGNGKGKTTAALGQALRALGNGKRALMVQFIKSAEWETGEAVIVKRLEPDLKLVPMGRGFVGILGDTLPREVHEKAARKALAFAEKELPDWDIVVLDEVNVALHLTLLPIERVIAFIQTFPKEKDLILTGRWAPKELYSYADYVTEMKEIKHPFEKGQVGKRGKEW